MKAARVAEGVGAGNGAGETVGVDEIEGLGLGEGTTTGFAAPFVPTLFHWNLFELLTHLKRVPSLSLDSPTFVQLDPGLIVDAARAGERDRIIKQERMKEIVRLY